MRKSFFLPVFEFANRYKVLHILFWAWTTLDLAHILQQDDFTPSEIASTTVILISTQIALVYFTVGYLMPRYFGRRHYLRFVLFFFFSLVLAALVSVLLRDIEMLIRHNRHLRVSSYFIMFISAFTDSFIKCSLFFALYVIKDVYNTELLNSKLEREKLSTELSFLRAQLNPHFLFNAINSIYVLIKEDKNLAGETLLKFSALLRYQLYECSNERTSIERELAFLEDYISLEKMRCNENLKISFDVTCNDNTMEIAPLILMPFVENAFKHKSNHRNNNYISINAELRGKTFIFTVSNTFTFNHGNADEPLAGGIGLQNVKRRLELLYPGLYNLDIDQNNGIFNIKLEIKLTENEMYHSR